MTTPHFTILITHGNDSFAWEHAIVCYDVKTIHKLLKAKNCGYGIKI